jgi:hypothetical protein
MQRARNIPKAPARGYNALALALQPVLVSHAIRWSKPPVRVAPNAC